MNRDQLIQRAHDWREILSCNMTRRAAQRLVCKAIISKMLASKGMPDADPIPGVSDEILEEIAGMDLRELPFEVLSDIYESYLVECGQRKGKGIYYTPRYIVRYIVDRTLGRYLSTRTPEDIRDLRILDPACGSGSFLTYTFDVLAEFYASHDPPDGTDWFPVILENHLYGVDLDGDAVDITRAILMLKFLERMGHIPAEKPKLNVKRGNFLIEKIPDAEGFTMILGNPPYGAQISKAERTLIKLHYETYRSSDSSSLFVEKAVKTLKNTGILGFIVPKSLSYVVSWRPIREFLLDKCSILEIADAQKAFEGVLLEQMVIIAQKEGEPGTGTTVSILKPESSIVSHKINGSALSSRLFSIWLNGRRIREIVDKMWKRSVPLGQLAEVWNGLNLQSLPILSDTRDSEHDCPCLRGRDIQRYRIRQDIQYVRNDSPNLQPSILEAFLRPKIIAQDIVAHVKNPTPHIKIMAAIDKSGNWLNVNTVTNIASSKHHLEYLCSILNSRLISWYAYDFIYNRAMRTMHFRRGYADHIPIPDIDPANPVYRRLVGYVNDMMTAAEGEAAELDGEIDRLVYEIYGVTDADVKFLREHAGFY